MCVCVCVSFYVPGYCCWLLLYLALSSVPLFAEWRNAWIGPFDLFLANLISNHCVLRHKAKWIKIRYRHPVDTLTFRLLKMDILVIECENAYDDVNNIKSDIKCFISRAYNVNQWTMGYNMIRYANELVFWIVLIWCYLNVNWHWRATKNFNLR